MAVTKPEFWLVAVFFVIALSVSLLYFGNSAQDSDVIELDAESDEYLASFYTQNNNSAFIDATEDDNSLNDTKTNPLLSKIGELPLISDAVGVVNWVIDKSTKLFDFLAFIYNLPTFFLTSFGMDLEAMSHLTNLTVYIMTIFVVIMMVRFTK